MRGHVLLLILAVVAAIGSAALAGPYLPSPCTDGTPAETHGANEISITNPATGGHIYAENPDSSPTNGYVGTHGSTGYVEAYSDAANSVVIEGQTADGKIGASVHGRLGEQPADVCVIVKAP